VKSGEIGKVPLKVAISRSPLEENSQVHIENGKQQAMIFAMDVGAEQRDNVRVIRKAQQL
jgi:hypothetical protein